MDDLQSKLTSIITNLKEGKLDDNVIGFYDYKSKYTFLKSRALVKVELTEGIEATIDITEYFDEVFK